MLGDFFARLERFFAVKLDDSSSLTKTSRDEYKYIEGDHEMLIYVEVLEKAISESSIQEWLPPYSTEKISDAKKKEILEKLCKYFSDRKMSYKIIPEQ
jgi:hypothetical protein